MWRQNPPSNLCLRWSFLFVLLLSNSAGSCFVLFSCPASPQWPPLRIPSFHQPLVIQPLLFLTTLWKTLFVKSPSLSVIKPAAPFHSRGTVVARVPDDLPAHRTLPCAVSWTSFPPPLLSRLPPQTSGDNLLIRQHPARCSASGPPAPALVGDS